MNSNSQLIRDMGFIELKEIDITKIDLENTLLYNKQQVVILSDGIAIHNIFDRDINTIKKVLNKKNVYVVTKEHLLEIKQKVVESDIAEIKIDDTNYIAEDTIDDTEINKLLHSILTSAVRSFVSDIHIIPKEHCTKILFRDTGDLKVHKELPKNYCNLLVNKLKTKGNMDITNKLIPQDGQAKYIVDDSTIELRISTLPTVWGENSVLRVQQSDSVFDRTLDSLGFFPEDLEKYRKAFNRPYGMLLNVGATGAGKTTTFYLTIAELVNKYEGSKNIMTVEDPVEIKYDKITQVEASDKQKRGFGAVLKSFMRQDPDIILLGEIRDAETGAIGVKAALTGHMVLSTLHANESFNAITRLRDLGISNQLISSTLNCVLSQRLVKKLCPSCKAEYEISDEVIETYLLESKKAFRPVGCAKCNNTGFIGREAVVEVLEFDDEYKTAISEGKSEVDLKKIAKQKGFKNLWHNGVRKLALGIISLEQLALVIAKDPIINVRSYSQNKILSIRELVHPQKIIANFEGYQGMLYDYSKTGISFLFDKKMYLDLDKNYKVIIDGNQIIDFNPRSHSMLRISGEEYVHIGGKYIGEVSINNKSSLELKD